MKRICLITIILIIVFSGINLKKTFAWFWNQRDMQDTSKVPNKVLIEDTVPLMCYHEIQDKGKWFTACNSRYERKKYNKEIIDKAGNIIDNIGVYIEPNFKDNCIFWIDEGYLEEPLCGKGEVIKSISLYTSSEKYPNHMKHINITPINYPKGVITLPCGEYAVAEVKVRDDIDSGYLGSPPSRDYPIWIRVCLEVCIKQGKFE